MVNKTKNPHILNQYLKHHQESNEKYGKSIVLMQVGSFSEIYNKDINSSGGPNLKEISDLLNCSIAMKGKNTENSHYMIGFPKVADSKYISILIKDGYHVILIEQSNDGSSTHIKREISTVVSAGTAMEYDNNINNYLMSIYIENYDNNDKIFHGGGVSIIDISTGKNYITHILDSISNRDYEAAIIHYINIYSPSEVIIHNNDKNCFNKLDYIRLFNISHNNVIVNFFNDKDLKKFSKINYQNNFLQEIFNFKNMLDPIQNIHCEMKSETVLSYIILLEYAHQHRKNVKMNIELPEELENITYLNLTNNSIRQINVISNSNNYKGTNDSLITVINKCKTPMGKRLLRERILKPFINPDNINKSYEYIELFLRNDFYNIVRNELQKISDFEKSIRKMGLNDYNPDELLSDNISFDFIKKTLNILNSDPDIYNKTLEYSDDIKTFLTFDNELNNHFEWDNFNSINNNNIVERSLFKRNIYNEIDEVDLEINNNVKRLDLICARFSKFIDQKSNNNLLPIKIEYSDKDNWYIYTTKVRGLKLKERFNNLGDQNIIVKDEDNNIIYTINPNSVEFKKHNKNEMKIELDEITVISHKIVQLNKKLSYLNNKYWTEYIEYIYEKFNKSLKNICKLISEIDFYTNAAYISHKNRYHKPKIIDHNKSFLDIKEIRHPIIELINDKHEYIKNNISFGLDNQHDGILLFGTNSCGKSSLMKAIGLNLVMAQAGMYTSSLQFNYYPYKKLYTRILNTDNIFSGQSSFIVEMNELREILYSADENSLVLADELAIGTETTSALSIVASSLKILCDRKTSFICTSHLHQLNDLSVIKNINNLKTYHLKISNEGDTIIYDRTLTEGPGPAVYGLNVCSALNMSQEFITSARQVQMEINNENNNIISEKKSTYNNSICMGECSMPICDNDAQETHHINEQADADDTGNFNHFHKNVKHNLIPLCKECHAQITYGNLHIKGWKETSEGDVLDFEFIDNKQLQKKSNKKFSDKDIEYVKQYYNKYNNLLSKQKILDKLLSDKNIKMGLQTYNKIIKDEY
jgi:DNA mismatch repair protein MutS